MNPLTQEEKFEIIDNIKSSGKEDELDYAEVIRSIERLITNKDYEEPASENTIPQDFFERFNSLTPQQLIDFTLENSEDIREESNVENYSLDMFFKSLNESNIMPYKVMKRDIKGGSEYGFFRGIDRYEQATDRQNNPIYLRFYNDDTYDVLDKETFDMEKYFNYMPKNLKNKIMALVDETSMDIPQRAMLKSNILEHQAKQFTSEL